jgi:hypothetical protein
MGSPYRAPARFATFVCHIPLLCSVKALRFHPDQAALLTSQGYLLFQAWQGKSP